MFSRAVRRPSAWRLATASGRLRREQGIARAQLEQVGADGAASARGARAVGGRPPRPRGRAQRASTEPASTTVADARRTEATSPSLAGTDLVLHLHRLDDREHRAARDAAPASTVTRDDAAGERRAISTGAMPVAAQPGAPRRG